MEGSAEEEQRHGIGWMYKGLSGMVDREEYLLGRTVDQALKHIDEGAEAQKEFSYFDEVEKDITPASIFSQPANLKGPIDIVKKIKEDPLYQIEKKEQESLKQLLKNPVKMKQLRKVIEERESSKSKKRKKKHRKRSKKDSSSNEDSDEDLTSRLLGKINLLKASMAHSNPGDIKHLAKPSSSASKSRYQSSTKSSESQRHRSRSPVRDSDKNRSSFSKDSKYSYRYESRRYKSEKDDRKSTRPSRYEGRNRNFRDTHSSLSKEEREQELERKRMEMMENAKWRDEQRKAKVDRYREELKKEEELLASRQNRDSQFINRQLNEAASTWSVEKRIKSNSYHIQKGSGCMDTNFARR